MLSCSAFQTLRRTLGHGCCCVTLRQRSSPKQMRTEDKIESPRCRSRVPDKIASEDVEPAILSVCMRPMTAPSCCECGRLNVDGGVRPWHTCLLNVLLLYPCTGTRHNQATRLTSPVLRVGTGLAAAIGWSSVRDAEVCTLPHLLSPGGRKPSCTMSAVLAS